jgi:LysR family transcriptional regulator, hydrogen peroxide-inducible genes activator
MNFQQLTYIVALDDHKHFSDAAFSCDVTQATLSAMVIKLEKDLGFSIFDRSTKPITTTELGLEVVARAKDILSKKNEIDQIGQTVPQSLSGKLSIGVIPTIANSMLRSVLPSLIAKNPNLELTIKEITTNEIIGQLKNGSLDIGIAATPVNEKNIDEEIMFYEPMLVYGISDKKKKFVVNDEILDEKIWLLEEGHCFRDQVSTVCKLKENRDDLQNLKFEGNSFETLLSMVDQFGGFTLIPELYYAGLSPGLKEKSRMFQKPIPVREVSLLSYGPSRKDLTIQYLSAFIQDLIEPELSTSKFQNKDLRIVGLY